MMCKAEAWQHGRAKAQHSKAQHGDDLKSKAKEMQSTDQIGKGSALFRNDTKRHSRDLYRIDLQRKSWDTLGVLCVEMAQHRKAMAETGVQWRRNEWQWQYIASYAMISNGNETDLHS